jgi:type IV pilus assembly protein PilM
MPVEYGDDDIEASIQIEAAQYIPFPLEEIYIDFQVQAGTKALAETQEVMLVASRKEYVDLRADALHEAGLKPSIVDVEAYALENAYPILEEGASTSDVNGERAAIRVGDVRVALVDMGATITTLYVFQENKVIFAREQTFGGDQLTASIADTYGLEKGKAELAKRSGELSEDYPATILAPFKQSAAEQIGNALQFFFSSSHYNSVDKIILVGGGALVPGLAGEVARRLKIPTIIGSCFEQMSNASRVNRRGQTSI